MSTLTALNENTVRLIGSTQVITSVFSVVKELVENALDAGSSTVDVRLENFGLDKVEVRDNGSGIPNQNVPYVAKRYHTSKINSFNDIQTLETYGFRGEALGSLCTVSTLSITTKTADDDVSLTYVFNSQGQITSSHPSHLSQGTTITATSLFKNLPVRRQFYNTVKKKKEELKKVEDLLISYAIILPKVRITLTHNKEKVFQKNGVSDTRTALLGILGINVLNNLVQKTVELEDPKVTMEMFLPNPKGDIAMTSKSDSSRYICAINSRPVHLKDFEKIIRQHYINHMKCEGLRHPVCFLSFTMATDQIDVNVDPNKTTVLLHHKKDILKGLTVLLEEMYGSIEKTQKTQANNLDLDSSREDNSSVSDAGKGDNSSDFGDSFSVQSVTKRQPDLPVIKITTHGNAETEIGTKENSDNYKWNQNIICHSKSDSMVPKCFQNGKTFSADELNEKENTRKDDTNPNELGSALQVGKPVFTIIEDTLDDLLADTQPNMTESSSPCGVLSTASHREENGERHSLNGKEIQYQPNPQLTEAYQDIVSTWKDTQTGPDYVQKSDMLEPVLTGTKENLAFTDTSLLTVDTVCHERNTNVDNLLQAKSAADEEFLHTAIVDDSILTPNCSRSESVLEHVQLNKSADADENIMNIKVSDIAALKPCETSSFNNKEELDGRDVNGISNSEPGGRSDKGSNSAETWSRGQSLTNDTSDIQPVSVLPGKRFMPIGDQPPSKRRSIVQEERQRRLSDVVSSQAVKHPMTAFSLYCKDNRSFVVSKNPLADYDKITRILETNWNELSEDEREKYFQKTSPVKTKQTPSSHKKDRRLGSRMKGSSRKSQTWTTIKDQLLKQKSSTALQKVKEISFCMNDLKDTFTQRLFPSQSHGTTCIQPIGPLRSSGVWVGYHDNSINIINPHRIQETVLYHKLMADHIIQCEQLEQPIQLTENYLGPALWSTLISLAENSTDIGVYRTIQDKRLTSNGIEITFHKDESGFTAKVTGMTKSVPVYGIADVKEVLQLITKTRAITLYEARPLKILNYLQGEAVRMARQLPRQQTKDDIVDVISQMEVVLPWKCDHCLHNKPFLHKLYSLDDLPLTQSQTQQT